MKTKDSIFKYILFKYYLESLGVPRPNIEAVFEKNANVFFYMMDGACSERSVPHSWPGAALAYFVSRGSVISIVSHEMFGKISHVFQRFLKRFGPPVANCTRRPKQKARASLQRRSSAN